MTSPGNKNNFKLDHVTHRILLSNMQILWSTEVGHPKFMNYCLKRGSYPSNIQPSQFTDVLYWLIDFSKQALHRQSPCCGIKDGEILFSANFGYLSTANLWARQLGSSVVGRATRMQAIRCGIRIPVETRDFSRQALRLTQPPIQRHRDLFWVKMARVSI